MICIVWQLYLLWPAQFLGSSMVSSWQCGSLPSLWTSYCTTPRAQRQNLIALRSNLPVLSMSKWRNIMENSLRASSATSHWFLAWIYCSKLWRILMAMVTSWSHCWAKPTVECSVYLLSRINFSSRIAPKSSFLRRLVQWHIQQHDEPKENNFILNCYTKMNLTFKVISKMMP